MRAGNTGGKKRIGVGSYFFLLFISRKMFFVLFLIEILFLGFRSISSLSSWLWHEELKVTTKCWEEEINIINEEHSNLLSSIKWSSWKHTRNIIQAGEAIFIYLEIYMYTYIRIYSVCLCAYVITIKENNLNNKPCSSLPVWDMIRNENIWLQLYICLHYKGEK